MNKIFIKRWGNMNLIISELTNNIIKIEPDVSRIDSSSAGKFKELLFDSINSGNNRVILDLNQVSFIDSSGLGVIVAAYKKIKIDGKLVILTKSQAILTMFKITRLEKVLDIVNSENILDAIKIFDKE
jgi:anti-sigma B factor antagonist